MKNHTENDEKICPGGEHLIIGYPALSRFGHGDICSDCGVKEAFEGDFILTEGLFNH